MSDHHHTAPRNTWVLTAAQSLGGASTPIVVSLGGLVGQQLSSNPALVTLPVSLLNLGLALGTIPAAVAMRHFGRRSSYVFGAMIGMLAGLVATTGIVWASFLIFCAGTFLAGFYSAYVQSYRFAATDGLGGHDRERAIARVMLGGLAAAIIGPQLVIWTREALPGHAFAGPEERGRAQGVVFGAVACASFFSGSLLHSSGWGTVNRMVFPAVAFVLAPLLWRATRTRNAAVR
ncbi:MAG: hypothetical protein D1H97_16940 [Paracoccus sp. BP8]|nr:MAG: hypothetical protein D1H97_16940 [Paracoccus sp. BP8]